MATKAQTTVLLIEDNPTDVRLVEELLRDTPHASFTVIAAPTLAQGLKRLSANSVDAVLLDLGLPDSQGIDTFRALYEHAPHLPIIILTVSDDEALGQQAVREGAQRFVSKDALTLGTPYAGVFTRMIRFSIEHKRAEDALKTSEESLQTLFEFSPIVQIRYDQEGYPIMANRAAREFLGIDDVSAIQHLTIFTSPRVSDADKARFRAGKSARYEQTYDFDAIRQQGGFPTTQSGVRYVDFYLAPIFNTDGTLAAYLAQVVDITERKRAEEERESLAMFPAQNPNPVFRLALDGTVLFANTPGEMLVNNVAFPLAEVRTLCERAYAARADRTVEVIAGSRTYDLTLAPIAGKRYVNVYGRDITARKRAEAALKDAERLAAIGQTAAMIGHDLRNPLQGLQYIVDLQKLRFERMPPEKRGGEDWQNEQALFDRISDQIFYMDKIVGDLQDYARPVAPEHETVALDTLINDVLDSLPHADGVQVVIDTHTLDFTADPRLMRRVFANLILNAVQAMPNGGVLTISATTDDDSVAIHVTDTGVGIAADMHDKIFSPLTTGKRDRTWISGRQTDRRGTRRHHYI